MVDAERTNEDSQETGDDLAARLREAASEYDQPVEIGGETLLEVATAPLLRAAADEIERLRPIEAEVRFILERATEPVRWLSLEEIHEHLREVLS